MNRPAKMPDPTPSRTTALAAAIVAAAAVACYAGTLGHGFALDDGPEVVDNAYVRSVEQVGRVLSSASWAGSGGAQVPMYRPLTTFTYSLNYAAGGLAPAGYHLVNVALNAGVSVLVLFLGLHLGMAVPAATIAGLLFAVLPVHVEAVANVAGRKDLLVALFSIAAVLAHSRALRRGGIAVVAAPVLVAAALLSKESGLVLVGLLAAHDLLFERDAWRSNRGRAVALLASYLLLTLAFVALRHAVLDTLVFPRVPFDENPVAEASAAVRIMTAVAVLGLGLRLLVLPWPLSADYSFAAIEPVTSPLDPGFVASLTVIVGLGVLAWRFRKRFPLGAFAFLWYGITILPASNLLVPIGTIFGERLLYVPSVAFALVAASGAGALLRSPFRLPALALTGLLLVAFGLRTWGYSRAWASDLEVFTAAAAARPESAKAQRMLGGALVEAGRPEEAAAAFQRAIAITGRPGTPQHRMLPALVELGVSFERLGKLQDAEGIYAKVLSIDPRNADATWRLGVVRWEQGDRDRAVVEWQRALAIDPAHARALNDLGVAAFLAGDLDRAEALWTRATASDPTLGSAWYRLGMLHERRGDLLRAREAWRRFLDTSPPPGSPPRVEVERKLGAAR